jgi:hypothetical protein
MGKARSGSGHGRHRGRDAAGCRPGRYTTTLDETLCEAGEQVAEQIRREAELRPQENPKVHLQGIEELVTDKG